MKSKIISSVCQNGSGQEYQKSIKVMSKKILYILVLLPILVIGQTTTENYIKTTTYRGAGQTNPVVAITYFDGLGRPIEQLQVGQSATGKNIVTPIVYDAYGRQVKDYLPYPTQTNTMDFIPVATALSDQSSYAPYSGQVSFSEKLFEASTFNRVLKQSAPGNTWAMGSGKEIKFDYQTNVSGEVKLYRALATGNIINFSQNGSTSYPANQLIKIITKDENWTSGLNNTTEEFKDKEGKIVLKRTYDNGIAHDTYYVNDQYGNLTYVIAPLVTNPTIATELDGLCYQYKYDYRNRLVEKKLPGKQWEYIIYDKLDRVVATGPALSPFTDAPPNTYGWLVTKYDAFNRVVYTGWQQEATAFSSSLRATRQNTVTVLTTFSESKVAANTIDGVSVWYSNSVVLFSTAFKLLTVNYYDNYDYPNAPTSFVPIQTGVVYYNNSTQKPRGLATGSWIRVLQAITDYPVAERNWLLYDYKARPIRSFTLNYLGGYTLIGTNYDFTKVLNTTKEQTRAASTTFAFASEGYTYTPQERVLTHTHRVVAGTTGQLLSKNEYDELGQLISKRVGGTDLTGASALQKVDYSYNIRGWLTGINDIANLTPGTDPTDLFSFKINYDTTADNVAGVSPLFNGNIAETYWRTSSDNKLRKYGYEYDNLNRLVNATYQKPETNNPIPNSYSESLTYDKNGNITHLIRNGGLDSGTNYVNALQVDDLNYSYNDNQLQAVYDGSNHTDGFKDGANNAQEYGYDNNGNMTRDDNKSITSITYNHLNLPVEIVFAGNNKINYLYTAAGQKVKKTVTVLSGGTSIFTTDYLDGFQYFNGVLNFIPHAEGYVKNTVVNNVNSFNYVFNYTDHLGNIRLSYGLNASNVLTILEENHYYPFGLKHSSYNTEQYNYEKMESNGVDLKREAPVVESSGRVDFSPFKNYDYKYNGNEYQDELSLNLYDYGARNYDPAIGRWMNIDPLADERQWVSPYSYVQNNPITRVDPTGMLDGDYYDSGGVYLGNDGVDDDKVYQLKEGYRAKTENTDVNWGGTLAENHSQEIRDKSNDLGTVKDAFVTGDAVSDKRIQSLHPAIRMQATDFIKEANVGSSGTLIRIAQGFRTYAEQDGLYAQSRTAPGPKVTNAKGGESNHNFGLAFDIVGITGGKMDYNLNWESLSKSGKANNFDWGGDWKSFKDKPHFENMFGNSLKALRALPKDINGLPILK